METASGQNVSNKHFVTEDILHRGGGSLLYRACEQAKVEVELSQKSVTGRQKLSQCAKERHSPPRTQISRWRPSVSEYINRQEKHLLFCS